MFYRVLIVCATAIMLVVSLAGCQNSTLKIVVIGAPPPKSNDVQVFYQVDYISENGEKAVGNVVCYLLTHREDESSMIHSDPDPYFKIGLPSSVRISHVPAGIYYVRCDFANPNNSSIAHDVWKYTTVVPCLNPQGGGPRAVLANVDPCQPPTPTDTPTAAPTPAYNFDQPFDRPQYLIHATGHGTVDGPVKDDFYTLYFQEPDAQGLYRVADGSGGTYTYSSDFHTGPLTTPRSVCQAAAARGLPPQQWTPYNRNNSFDCSLLTSSSTQPNYPAVPNSSQAQAMITSYYDTKGVFAGQYVLKQIDSITFGPQNGNQFTACAAYEYANPSTPNVSAGTDKRTFLFQYLSSNWQVVSMGDHMSC